MVQLLLDSHALVDCRTRVYNETFSTYWVAHESMEHTRVLHRLYNPTVVQTLIIAVNFMRHFLCIMLVSQSDIFICSYSVIHIL